MACLERGLDGWLIMIEQARKAWSFPSDAEFEDDGSMN